MIHQEEIGEADDRRQHIVEVVGDAAGELADRLHLLPLRDLPLERALRGRVDGVGDGRLAVALVLLDRAQIDPAGALLGAGKGDVDGLDQALPGQGGVKRAAERLMTIGLDQILEAELAALLGALRRTTA